jgi:glyoxylate carboligase
VASITLTPSISGNIGVSISGIVGADLVLETGLKSSLGVAFASPYLTGTAKISRTTKLYAEPWIGFDIPLIGRRSWNWPITIMAPQETTLAQWQIFKKALY